MTAHRPSTCWQAIRKYNRGQLYTPDHKHLDYLARMSILYVKYANKQ